MKKLILVSSSFVKMWHSEENLFCNAIVSSMHNIIKHKYKIVKDIF
jgi:hypothetical protein